MDKLSCMSLMLRPLILCCIATCLFATGCVRRTITISTTPPGALCYLNGREIGRTPVSVDFLYYGEYDVELIANGHEPLLTTGTAEPPIWDQIPLDLVAEVVPGDRHVKVAWHYELLPSDDDHDTLIDRAHNVRDMLGSPDTE